MAGPADEGVRHCCAPNPYSVMGFTEVLAQLPRIMRLLGCIKRTLAQSVRRGRGHRRTGFSLPRGAIAESLGIPVIYYISPKLWAWRRAGSRFLRRHVDRIISILPFEVDFYARHGMAIDYVGHPLLDSIRTRQILDTPRLAGESASFRAAANKSRPCCRFSPAPPLCSPRFGAGIRTTGSPRHGQDLILQMLDFKSAGHPGRQRGPL